MAQPLLEVKNLSAEFATEEGRLVAVDDVSFTVPEGGTVGLVGESGCGKSVTALCILRLLAAPAGRITGGRVLYRGEDLLALPEARMREVRGNTVSMIFQEPMTSLNPVFTVGDQIAEAVRLHQGATRRQARERAVEMLRRVGIDAPEQRVDAWPHQLSGGMRQRVMVAMALACDPGLLIADEPTTALDVTVQAQILELIRRLQRERQMAVLLITHDLGVVAETCAEVVVMYAGRVVERASVAGLFRAPRHPYTAGLLRSIPSVEAMRRDPAGRHRLAAIPGVVPDPRHRPAGCLFRDRCDRAVERCAAAHPALEPGPDGRTVACYNPVPPHARPR